MRTLAPKGSRSHAIDPALEARFKLARVLGSGGMGTVFEAHDVERDETVALKMLHSRDADSLYRFKREFRALSDLSHPNLVVLYELFATPRDWAFSMELVRGTGLLAWLKAEGDAPSDLENEPGPEATLVGPSTRAREREPDRQRETLSPPGRRGKLSSEEEKRLRSALLQFACGLAVLHESGHVHRDVKPSNVMVTTEGRVVVLDFGVIAELGPRPPRETLVVGTPSYMAPEQALPVHAPVPASDWYSFGVVMYELLAGRRPFLGDASQILAAKLLVEPPPVFDFAPQAPGDLVELCQALIKVDPAARPSGAEVLERLGGRGALRDEHIERARESSRTLALTDVAPAEAEKARTSAVRVQELDRIRQAFAEACAGRTRAVLVGGPSGFGKTTLAEAFLEDLASANAIVLRGRCYARESVPYKALDTLVDALSRWLSEAPPSIVEAAMPPDFAALIEAFPVLGRVRQFQRRAPVWSAHPDETRPRAFRGLIHVLDRLSAHRPVVVFVDDLQWGDLESAPFFTHLFTSGSSRLLFVGTFRDDEWSPLVGGLRESARGPSGAVSEVILEPLPPAALRAIARSALGDESAEAITAEIATRAGGSPYFAVELARQARAGNRSERAEAGSVHALLRARASSLSADARRLLDVVAVAGAALDRNVVEEAAEVQRAATKPLIELVAGHFVKPVWGNRVDTMHDAVREAILPELEPAAQRAIHLVLARALEARTGAGAAPDIHRIAQHYYLAFPDGDAAHVFAVCHEAARRAAASHAHDQAFEHVERARHVARVSSFPIDDAFHRLSGEVAMRTCRVDAAALVLSAMLDEATNGATRAQLRLARSRVFLARLDAAAAGDEALAGVRELGERNPGALPRELGRMLGRAAASRVRARLGVPLSHDPGFVDLKCQLWIQYALSGYFKMDRPAQLVGMLRAVDSVIAPGSSVEGVRWYGMFGALFSLLRVDPVAARFSAASHRAAEEVGTAEARGVDQLYHAHNLNFAGSPLLGDRAMRECVGSYGQVLSNLDFHLLVSHLVSCLIVRGYAADALAYIEKGLERASMETPGRRLDNRHTYACYRAVALAMLGRAAEGKPHLDAFGELIPTASDRWRRLHWLANRVSFLAESDAPRAALDEAARTLQEWSTPSTLPLQFRYAYAALGRRRLQALDGSSAARGRLVDAHADLARCGRHPSFRGKLLRLEAGIARVDGRLKTAERTLEQAHAVAMEIDDRLLLWDVSVERALLARGRGRSSAAGRHLDDAEELARSMGWEPRLVKVRELREQLGASSGAPAVSKPVTVNSP